MPDTEVAWRHPVGGNVIRENKVKRTLQQGGAALGTMVFEFAATGMGRVAANAGAEFVILDTEHSGFSIDTVRTMLAAWRADDLVTIVRVPAVQYHLLSGPLDAGAMGLMIPLVETEEQARFIVDSTKYTPVGRRGAAFCVAHDDYRFADVGETMQSANAETLLIAQIETARGVENVEAIAAVAGIDVLWIGQFDLTNSLGISGQFDHPAFQSAVDRVVSACRQHGKAAGYMAASIGEAQAMAARGFRCLAYWGDIWIYQSALRVGLSAIRGVL